MCLKDSRKVEVPYDTIAFKVVLMDPQNANDRFWPPFAFYSGENATRWYKDSSSWNRAHAVYNDNPDRPYDFGYHAYVTYTDARRAAARHHKVSATRMLFPVLLVELGDVIEEGTDGSFHDLKVPAVAARAMRILRVLP